MSNNVTWVGNRVMDPTRPASRPACRRDGGADDESRTDADDAVRRHAGDDDAVMVQGPTPSTENGYIPYYHASISGKT
jgi:hypothetical protein